MSDVEKEVGRVARRGALVAVPREMAQDGGVDGLSWQARGMLLYLLSKPDGWVVRISDLMREGNCGRERTDTILKELKNKGYARRVRSRNEKGRWLPGPLEFFENPEEKPEGYVEPNLGGRPKQKQAENQ